jgi:two-component system phosphate regulon response regulator PhoB
MKQTAKILIIESEAGLLSTLSDELEQEGYVVDLSATGGEAMRKLENKPNLIILDGLLSDIDGLVLLAKIKAEKNTREIPVILLLESGDESRAVSANELGVAESIVKTRSGLKSIMTAVEEILGKEEQKY